MFAQSAAVCGSSSPKPNVDMSPHVPETGGVPSRDGLQRSPIIKVEEGEIQEPATPKKKSLVEYSSSPPPLVEDDHSLFSDSFARDSGSEQTALHDDLKIDTYEFAALQERHSKLEGQHRELLKLASAHHEIIFGTSTVEEQVSINQLRVEAGTEGLREKASEADVLRPAIQEAGGSQALVSYVQSVRSIINQAGGLQELKTLVSDTQLLQISVDEAGGLQGLHNLISEVSVLRSEQQAHVKLRNAVGDLSELKSDATKYNQLKKAFSDICATPNRVNNGEQTDSISRNSSSAAPITINPARADRLSAPPLKNDPYRDLYEAPPLVRKGQSWKMTGSNDVPLGKSRAPIQQVEEVQGRTPWKRKYNEEAQITTKRPRINVGRASALVQASLNGKSMSGLTKGVLGYDVPEAGVGYSNKVRSTFTFARDDFVEPKLNLANATLQQDYCEPRGRGSNQASVMAGRLSPVSLNLSATNAAEEKHTNNCRPQ